MVPEEPEDQARSLARQRDVSLFTFMALQLARIQGYLFPEGSYPRHISGPRRPDMTEQEARYSDE